MFRQSLDPYPKWYRSLPVAVFMPWRNLGCLGLKVGSFYCDLYRRPWSARMPWLPGLFVCFRGRRAWVTVNGIRKDGV